MPHRGHDARKRVELAIGQNSDPCELDIKLDGQELTIWMKPSPGVFQEELYHLASVSPICDNSVVRAAFKMTQGLHFEEIVGLADRPVLTHFMTSPGVFGDVYGDVTIGSLFARLRYVGSPRSFADSQSRDLRLVARALTNTYSWARRKIVSACRDLPFDTIEIDILKWTAVGKTSQEVAAILGMTKRSVDDYHVVLSTKLGADNRAQAVVSAIELGLIGT